MTDAASRTHEPAPLPDLDHVVRVRAEQEQAKRAELPDPKQVARDHAEQARAKQAELPDLEQVARDRAEQALARVDPETRARMKHEEELRQHAELIEAMKARTEGSD